MTAPERESRATGEPAATRTRGDEALAAATRTLVETYAPALGLVPKLIDVHSGESGRHARVHGAHGLVDGGHVFLAPEAFDPATAQGRALLVHELTHLAQQRDPGADGVFGDPEAEARELARAAAEGRPLWRPAALLPPGARAADNGAVATLPKTPNPPAQAPPDPESQAQQDLDQKLSRFQQVAHDRLVDLLDGWWVSGSDVRHSLEILDFMPFVAARSVVRSLPPRMRADLCRSMEDVHHREHGLSAVAALSALPTHLMKALEVDNVQGLSAAGPGFGPLERRAALDVLRGLRPTVMQKLLRGDRKDAFIALLSAPPPPGTDLAELRQYVVLANRAGELLDSLEQDQEIAKVLTDVRALLEKPTPDGAVRAVEKLASLAPTPPPPKVADPGSPAAAAKPDRVTGDRPQPPDPGDRLRYAVNRLDTEKLMPTLLDALPSEERRADGPHAGKLLVVLSARAPYLTLALVESLLSYKFLDWAVTDAEARFAYVLVRSLPLDVQDRWQRMDEGKWFARLEENLPAEDILDGTYRGVGSSADPFDPKASNELLTDALATVKAIDRIVSGNQVEGHTAVTLIRQLLQLGKPDRAKKGRSAESRAQLLATAVHRLDSLGHLERILEALPDAYLMNEMWRGELLEIFAARDPRHQERHARKLLSYGFFDWAVTAREAWLAFQIVRQLSTADQELLKAENPDRWARIQSEMTPEMQKSASVTSIPAKTAVQTRDRLREQLRDRRLWTYARRAELRSAIIQLYALDDRRWVFLRSRDVAAYQDEQLRPLLADLGLYDPRANRTTLDPEQLRSTKLIQEGPFEIVGMILKGLAVSPWAIWILIRDVLPSLFTKTVQARDIHLTIPQWVAGGDLAGVRLMSDSEIAAEEERRRKRDGTKPSAVEANRLSMSVTPGEKDKTGIVHLVLPRLELSGLVRVFAGGSIRTGRVTLEGLDITGHFSDKEYQQPLGAEASFARAKVADAVYTSESLPGGMLGIANLDLTTFLLKSGRVGTESLAEKERPGYLRIPVIGPLIEALSNIIYLYGGLPGLSTFSDMAVAPLVGGAPALMQKATKFTAGEIFGNLANSALGLVTDGVFRPPKRVDERLAEATQMLRALSVSFDSVVVEGLSFAGVQSAARVEIGRSVLAFGRALPTRLRAEQRSLAERLRRTDLGADDRAAMTKRLDEITKKVEDLKPIEDELDQLEGIDRWNRDKLTPAQRQRMVELNQQLRTSVGGTLDLGAITITGLSGVVDAARVEIDPIHAEAAIPSRWGEYLPEDKLIERFQKERSGPTDPREALKGATASLSTGGIRVIKGTGGGPALRLNVMSLPTVSEVRQALERLPDDDRTRARRRMLTWWVTPVQPSGVAPLDRLAELNENPDSRTTEEERQLLRDKAKRDFQVSVDELSIGPVKGGLDEKTLDPYVVADFEAKGISWGAYSIDQVTGKAVGGDIPLKLGSTGVMLDTYVPGAPRVGYGGTGAPRVRAGQVSVQGLVGPGVEAKSITVNGLSGTVRSTPTEIRVPDLSIDSAELEGISYTSPESTMFARGKTRVGRLTADVLVQRDVDELGKPRNRTMIVKTLRIAEVQGDELGMDQRLPEPGYEVRATGGKLIGIWVRDLTIDLTEQKRPPVGVFGIDQFENLRFEMITRALEGPPTKVTGTLNSSATPSAAAVTVEMLEPAPGETKNAKRINLSQLELTEGELEMGKNKVSIKKAAIGGTVEVGADGATDLRPLVLSTVEVSSLDWHTDSGATLTARGKTVLSGVSVTGRWESDPDAKGSDQKVVPGRKMLFLEHLHVDRITSDDLHYVDGEVDVTLGRYGNKASNLLDVRDVDVRNLRWERPAGSKQGAVTSGTVTVGPSSAEFKGQLQKERTFADVRAGTAEEVRSGLFTQSAIGAQSISLGFSDGGKVSLRVRGLTGDIGLGTDRDATGTHASFLGFDTGDVDIFPDHIDIGGPGRAPLDLKMITVDALDWRGESLSLLIKQGEGALTMSGITARARIDLNPKGHPKGRLKRLLLRELVVTETRASGLRVFLGMNSIKLNSDQEATLGTLRLLPVGGGEGFEITPKKTGKGFDTKGKLDLAAFQLPWVQAEIATKLSANADFRAAGLTVEFLAAEGMKLDLREPSITNIQAKLNDDERQRLFAINPNASPLAAEFGIRAKNVHYEEGTDKTGAKTSSVTVTGTEVNGLFYVDTRHGLRVFVDRATVPTIEHDLTKGEGRIPNLSIKDASFTVDLATYLTSKGGSGTGSKGGQAVIDAWVDLRASLAPYHDVIGSLDGRLDFDVITDGSIYPVRATFANGALDYQRLGKALFPAIPYVTPSFVLNGEMLILRINIPGIADYDALQWNIPSGEVADLRSKHQVQVNRLLEPTPESMARLAAVVDLLPESKSKPRLGIGNVQAVGLSVRNPKEIFIPLDSGSIVLAPNALVNLSATGSLGGKDFKGQDTPGKLEGISIDQAKVARTHLVFGNVVEGITEVRTGGIEVTELSNASLTFDGFKPRILSGRISQAKAEGITWKRGGTK